MAETEKVPSFRPIEPPARGYGSDAVRCEHGFIVLLGCWLCPKSKPTMSSDTHN